ncbi:MAG: glycerophosphodiester phosphodiesterase family protein [Paracoccaceae bacterium]|nr:glycerophosphodiester phosphodiesterase family protein [Paracoccaceae bacterium]
MTAPFPIVPLPPVFRGAPLAHRGLHQREDGRPENSRAAFRAGIASGYGIECDVQLSADGRAMVFHDHDLGRLTQAEGPVHGRTAAELSRIPLRYSNEGIPTLEEVLGLVSGRAALLIEIKDQDGAMGENVGTLELAVAADLARYGGPVAVMSFNPHSVAAFGRAAPRVPRGLTTAAYDAKHWPALPAATRDRLREIPDYDRLGATFVSHEARDLHRPRLAELKAKGATLLCWTIRSAEEEAAARRHADNVTFEGYLPALATA